MLIFSFISKRIEWVKSPDKDIIILIVISFAMLVLGWLHLLFAQFPQNLRAIEHNQREQHEQMFVITALSFAFCACFSSFGDNNCRICLVFDPLRKTSASLIKLALLVILAANAGKSRLGCIYRLSDEFVGMGR